MIMTAPIGGTNMPSMLSQYGKRLQTPPTAASPPISPSTRVIRRLRVPDRGLQPTAPLYTRCAQTEPRLTNTKISASTDTTGPWPLSSGRKSPPFCVGLTAAPAATTTAPNRKAIEFAIGKAENEASTPSRPFFDQRVKSAVIVPASAKPAITSVTAPPKLIVLAEPVYVMMPEKPCS